MRTGRAAADAKLVAERLAALADDTGITIAELQDLWLTETADRLELAVGALRCGNLSEAVRLVHSAAGTTGICGAAALAHDLTSIERLAAAGRAADAQRALGLARDEFHLLTSVLHGGLRH
jgi:HPt (histidine-containing phosphotransfer) domain-containing protein